MTGRIAITAVWALLLATAAPAYGQSATALGGGELALDAADGVEWRREERLFIAEGAATARQGDVTLSADRLVAAYREKPGGGLEIFRVDAEGAVIIKNGDDTATGVRAAFDLDARSIVLSGPGVAYTGRAGAVTANDSLEYDLTESRAIARGGAEVVARQGRLTAAVIEATFDADRDLSVARAWGGVAIRTAQETIRARTAEYDVASARAVARGDVRITRGQNLLTGEVATVDLASGISRLAGADGGRVGGVVFPKAQ